MSNTSLSDSYSNLCRDYSSFLKWAISKISKNTTKWTDYTVSEPDTLLLSSISTMHDYAQYIIDQMYLNTDIDICTTNFLHQVSAVMGQYLPGTNTIEIPIYIINSSSENIIIEPYEVFSYNNELFTNPDLIIIPAKSTAESIVVRNTVNEMIYKIENFEMSKNLIPYPYAFFGNNSTKTINGITFTDNGDGSITANGTSTLDKYFELILNNNIIDKIDKTKTYTTSVTGAGRPEINIELALFFNGKWVENVCTLNKPTLDFSAYTKEFDKAAVTLIINKGASFENVVIKPMLEVGSTATEYEPYYIKDKKSNGEFLLNGQIEKSSISVFGIDKNGNQTELNSCDYIFDLLYDTNFVENELINKSNMYLQNFPIKPGSIKIFDDKNILQYIDNTQGNILNSSNVSVGTINYKTGKISFTTSISQLFINYSNWTFKYLLTSIDKEVLRIKISPSVLNNFTAILVKYTIIDDYPIKENLRLTILDNSKNKNLQISTISNVSINSEIPINDEKLIYLNSLTNIRTLCNKPYGINLGELSKRIDNYRLYYKPNGSDVIPLFEYTTYDNVALNGDTGIYASKDYFNNIYFNPLTSKLTIEFKSLPVYDLTINYNDDITITITNKILNNIINNRTLEIILQNCDTSYLIFVGFKNLGNFIQYDYNAPQSNKITNLTSEKQILLNKFVDNILIVHKTPQIKFLSPYILDLQSNIILNQDINQLELMTKITKLLYDTLIHGEIVSSIRGSYRRLELLIQNNIKEVININFTVSKDDEQVYVVNSEQHLVIDSPENYLNKGNIKFITRGDEQ